VFCHLSYAIIQRVISTLDEGSSVSSPPGFDMLRRDMLMILYSTEKNARHISFSLLSSLTVHDISAVVVSDLPVQFLPSKHDSLSSIIPDCQFYFLNLALFST
jgi:hypothetical protein